MRKLAVLTIAVALAASACWPFETGEAEEPTPSTGPVVSGPAFVEDVEFVFLESYPVQVRATIRGSLPTPCHQLVWDLEATEDGADVEITSAVDPGAVCAEVLEPFEVTIDVGSFETGGYTLIVNGESYPFTI